MKIEELKIGEFYFYTINNQEKIMICYTGDSGSDDEFRCLNFKYVFIPDRFIMIQDNLRYLEEI